MKNLVLLTALAVSQLTLALDFEQLPKSAQNVFKDLHKSSICSGGTSYELGTIETVYIANCAIGEDLFTQVKNWIFKKANTSCQAVITEYAETLPRSQLPPKFNINHFVESVCNSNIEVSNAIDIQTGERVAFFTIEMINIDNVKTEFSRIVSPLQYNALLSAIAGKDRGKQEDAKQFVVISNLIMMQMGTEAYLQ